MQLNEKVSVVTGAAGGIGQATARRLAADGAAVVLTDLREGDAEAVASSLRLEGRPAFAVAHDVTDEAAWEAVIAQAVSQFGPVSVLVNNAGITTPKGEGVEQETIEGWSRLIAVNQTGVWLGMKHVAPTMLEAGAGSIVNISSIYGTVGGFGASIAYHASKGAVRTMTKNAALRWATEGIRVNSVHPGFIDTPMTAKYKGTEVEAELLAMTPMGRPGTAEEVANVVAFLASDLSSYMTGSEVYVDGGWTAK
jgi:NAD(P)-dependent dehydrogenase (short-subunit alcohol dehydrogenase family)